MRPALLLLASLPCATLLPAQQLRTLSRPDVEFEEPFTSVNGIRELKDGRVVVIDIRDKVAQLVDFRSGTARKIGREGSGPKEYALPMALVALPGDTSGIYDPLNQRMLLVHPDGSPGDFVKTAPEGGGTRTAGGFSFSLTPPRYTDAQGRFYYVGGALPRPDAAGESPDSQPVLRYVRGAKATDTVAWVRVPRNNVRVTGGGNRQTFSAGVANPFAPRDEWVVAPDGRVAVIRSPEYRIDWRGPTQTTGTPIAYHRIKVTEKHKEQWRETRRSGGVAIMMRAGPQGTSVSSGTPASVNVPEPTDWPEVMPPFTQNAAFLAPNGQIWVARTRDANDNVPKYDVLDASGRLAGRVALPARTRVVGFGAGSVYTVRTDEDDLQYLQRFRMP